MIYETLTEEDQEEALKELIEAGLDGAAGGIAKLVLAEGLDSLTKKQLSVFKNHVDPSLMEGCYNQQCSNQTLAGRQYCDSCAIRFG
ncbi:hypothetical protein EPZ47_18765 [Pseudomonas viciae]|uniref:Uncharacterized protein n=1 Tax=Pseudomonas viciae TaxID=2505979 RepID=A0A4P7PIV9_9PSED|nr:hypothetical protein [Pseudomonas viciae]QBZ90671.1 hypothetical protein EPZ47_18765 [Pseudomonas viciae]